MHGSWGVVIFPLMHEHCIFAEPMDDFLQSLSATQLLTSKIWSDACHLHSAYTSDVMLQGQNPIHLAVMHYNDCPDMLFEGCPLDLLRKSPKAAMCMKDYEVIAIRGCITLHCNVCMQTLHGCAFFVVHFLL